MTRAVAATSFATFILVFASVRSVPPASIGVVSTFGRVDGTVDSGLHLVNPFAAITLFSTKTQLLEQQNHGTENA